MSGGSAFSPTSSTNQSGASSFANAGSSAQSGNTTLDQVLNALVQQQQQTQQVGTQTGTSGSNTAFNTQNQQTTAGQTAEQQAQQQAQQQFGTTAGQTAGTTAGQVGPWSAAAGNLTNLLSGLNSQYGNVGINPTEASAYNQMSQNATNAPNYAPQAQGIISGLLSGDPTGQLRTSLNAYQTAMNPIATGSLDPRTNPGTADLLASVRNDVQNSINGQFAGAGRDLSGLNQNYLARGITGAEAPILLNQYNTNVANRDNAAGGLLGAATQNASLQGQNQGQAFNIIPMLQQLQNSGPQQQLAIQAAMRNQPIGTLGTLAGITSPIAALGQTSAGQTTGTSAGQTAGTQTGQMTGNTTGQTYGTTSGTQTGNTTTNAFTNLLNSLLSNMTGSQATNQTANQMGTSNQSGITNLSGIQNSVGAGGTTSTPSLIQQIGQGLGLAGLLFSDVRLKEDIQKVGGLFNGLNVYTFRYKGDPTTHLGMMAQEVERVHPEAVGEVGGYKAVDYKKAVQ